jgi:hypothetical protein
MAANGPRLSILDRLLTSSGFATLGKTLRDSVINAFGALDETPQDVFTVFEYRHVHRDDWEKLRAQMRRCALAAPISALPRSTTRGITSEIAPTQHKIIFVRWIQGVARKVRPEPSLSESSSLEERPWHKKPELKLKTYPYMLFPLALSKILWDYIIIALVAFNVLELPYSIAFESEGCDVCPTWTLRAPQLACLRKHNHNDA